MAKKSFLDSINVKNPCSESWDEMTGTDKIRFCSHCAKNVNNISEMTPAEAMRLVRRSGGRLCVRYRTDPKTNAPVFTERVAKFARQGAVAGVLGVSLLGGAYAQDRADNVQLVQIERTDKTGGSGGKISGYVTDPHGAAIAYALVTLTNQETMMAYVQNASGEGFYEFKDLEAGKYKLRFEAGGFAVKESSDVYLTDTGEARHDGQLALNEVNAAVEVKAEEIGQQLMGIMVGDISVVVARNELVSAVMREDFENVKARIVMGAKINVRDKAWEGKSPLHAAVESGNLEIAEYLLVHGAKANIRDSEKRTPVMMIEDEDTALEMFQLLVRFGAKLTLKDKEKNTVLHHLAANVDNPEIVKAAIAGGVNVNAVNKEGKTALIVAVDEVNTDSVEAMLESGADVNARDREGKTAFDYSSAEVGFIRSKLTPYGAVSGVGPK